MKPTIVVTEGITDVALLRTILGVDASNTDTIFVPAGGWSAADSLARSILVRNEGDVALVVDADTIDANGVEERRQFLHHSLCSIVSTCRFGIFVIVPEIESLLFQNRNIVEKISEHKITDEDFVRGQYEPKRMLKALLNGQAGPQMLESRFMQVDLSPLRELPVIQAIQEFLNTARHRVPEGE